MSQFDDEKLTLLREYINSMTLTQDDFLAEAFKKIKEKRTAYLAMPSKTDALIAPIIDPRFKKILTVSEDALTYIKDMMSMQSKYF